MLLKLNLILTLFTGRSGVAQPNQVLHLTKFCHFKIASNLLFHLQQVLFCKQYFTKPCLQFKPNFEGVNLRNILFQDNILFWKFYVSK